MGSRGRLRLLLLLFIASLQAQIIEFESGGLKYKTLTRNGVTVMFAPLPLHVRDYAVMQVSISNGSPVSWAVKPEDFRFEPAEGSAIQALPAKVVVDTMLEKASRGDVIKMISAYETALYGNSQIHSTNGYESRRQGALADVGSGKLKAAAATSAIALVTTKLLPGQSTDGAIFYPSQGKPLGAGHLIVTTAGETFTFPVDAVEVHPKHGS
jgi:hypothetical protein